MRIPIAYVMGGENRIESGVKPFDFFNCDNFSFSVPDYKRYPCLKLAIDACYQGQQATTTLNAANEIAVDAFLKNKINFVQISQLVDRVLSEIKTTPIENLAHLFAIDQEAKQIAQNIILRDTLC